MPSEAISPVYGLLGLLAMSGLFFWASMLLSTKTGPYLQAGGLWLEWRPLPHDLPRRMGWAFLLGFVMQILFSALLLKLNLLEKLPVGVVVLLPMILFQGLMTLAMYLKLHRSGLHPLEVLGMEQPMRVHDLVWGLMAFCMCLPLVFLTSLITSWLFSFFQWEINAQPMIELFSEVEGWMNWVSLFLLVGFIGPLLEEVVFRGFLHTWLHQKLGLMPGLFLQAFLFALIHQHATSMLPLFALAVLLGLVYLYTRRLMACVWLHALFNTLSLIMTFFMSKGELLP